MYNKYYWHGILINKRAILSLSFHVQDNTNPIDNKEFNNVSVVAFEPAFIWTKCVAKVNNFSIGILRRFFAMIKTALYSKVHETPVCVLKSRQSTHSSMKFLIFLLTHLSFGSRIKIYMFDVLFWFIKSCDFYSDTS